MLLHTKLDARSPKRKTPTGRESGRSGLMDRNSGIRLA